MREIKFRGKRIDNGEWVYGDLMTKYVHHEGLTIVENGCIYHEVDPKTVGQDTGYKGIHQGDIAKVEHDEIGSPIPLDFVGEVKYMECGFYVVNDKKGMAFKLYQEIAEWKIIGNIHNNPELLEGDEGE
jgi:uncharacterized phage protein (TIGR01671 family)